MARHEPNRISRKRGGKGLLWEGEVAEQGSTVIILCVCMCVSHLLESECKRLWQAVRLVLIATCPSPGEGLVPAPPAPALSPRWFWHSAQTCCVFPSLHLPSRHPPPAPVQKTLPGFVPLSCTDLPRLLLAACPSAQPHHCCREEGLLCGKMRLRVVQASDCCLSRKV